MFGGTRHRPGTKKLDQHPNLQLFKLFKGRNPTTGIRSTRQSNIEPHRLGLVLLHGLGLGLTGAISNPPCDSYDNKLDSRQGVEKSIRMRHTKTKL